MFRWTLPVVLVLSLLTFACSNEDDSTVLSGDSDREGEEEATAHSSLGLGCNPLMSAHCLLPYPSMALLVEDDASPTGLRVGLKPEHLPFEGSDSSYFVNRFNRADGFSVSTPIVAVFEGQRVDPASLPSLGDPAASVLADSPIQLLDRENGTRIPLWAEPDRHAGEDVEQPILIRVLKALEFNRRYVVVLTNGLVTEKGGDLHPSAAFKALRDNEPSENSEVDVQRPSYEELFEFLEESGTSRNELLAAWEFHTMSEDMILATIPPMVERAVEVLPESFEYEVTECWAADAEDRDAFGCEVLPDHHALSWRRVHGTFNVPSFLDENGRFVLDEEGKPILQGTTQAVFDVNLPRSLKGAEAGSAPVTTFGHGLMASGKYYLHDTDDENGQMTLSNKLGHIFASTEWRGLCTSDLGEITAMIQDFTTMFEVSDLVAQGMVNMTMVQPFIERTFKDDPLMQASNGGSLVDIEHHFYTGISQGAIFGSAFMAVNPWIRSAVLHVGSSCYANIIQHSDEFTSLQLILDTAHPEPLKQQLALAFAQRLFDPVDPINWVGRMTEGHLTDMGQKYILWQNAVNDSGAPEFGAQVLARSGKIPMLEPFPESIWGVTETLATPTGPGTSGIMLFDPGKPEPSDSNAEVINTGAHHALRQREEIHEQIRGFFEIGKEGTILTPCDGPCRFEGESQR